MKHLTYDELQAVCAKQTDDFIAVMENNMGIKVINIDPAIRLANVMKSMAEQRLACEEVRKDISVSHHPIQPEPKPS